MRSASLPAATPDVTALIESNVLLGTQLAEGMRAHGCTRLVNTAPSTRQFNLGEWLGAHRVPAKVAQEQVTVVRSVEGFTLACAPSLSPRRFSEPTLEQGEAGKVLLATLATFAHPRTVSSAVAELGAKAKLAPPLAREVVEHLVEGRFLQPAPLGPPVPGRSNSGPAS